MIWTTAGAVAIAYQLVAVATGLPRISVLWPWNALGAVAFLAHFALERSPNVRRTKSIRY